MWQNSRVHTTPKIISWKFGNFFSTNWEIVTDFFEVGIFQPGEKPLPQILENIFCDCYEFVSGINSEVSILNCSLLWSDDCLPGWFVDCPTHLAPLRNMKERKTVKCLFFCLHGICFFWWIVKFGLHNSQIKEKYLLMIYHALERIPLHESESAKVYGGDR